MCILLHHPKDTCFTQEQLADFYSKNPDGFGAIVKRGDTVEVIKSVGSLQEIEDLYYQQVACFESVIHFRMKTHGDIDLANCHPYEVLPGLWMAHNGILSTGNADDPKMSDTWHYIQKYLKPMLEKNPELLRLAAFRELVGSHIGSTNKFAFMNQDGETFIINKTSGVMHKDVWYSNTYAWSPGKFGYYANYYGSGYGHMSRSGTYDHSKFATSSTWKEWDKIDREEKQTKQVQKALPFHAKPKKRGKQKKSGPKLSRLTSSQLSRLVRSSYNTILMEDYNGIVRWVTDHPMKAANLIYEIYGSEKSKEFNAQNVVDQVNNDPDWGAECIIEMWSDMEDIMLKLGGIDKHEHEGNAYVQQ